MSNVGQDVEHIWSCLQIRRCGSFPLVWSEFGGGEVGGTIWLHGCTESTAGSAREKTQIYFRPNFDDFLDKSKYTLIFAGFTELLAAQNVEKFVYNFTLGPSVPKIEILSKALYKSIQDHARREEWVKVNDVNNKTCITHFLHIARTTQPLTTFPPDTPPHFISDL